LVDDLDGKVLAEGAGETIAFVVDDVNYELDLSRKNAKRFRGVFQPIAAGRSVGGRTRRGAVTRAVPITGPPPKFNGTRDVLVDLARTTTRGVHGAGRLL